MSNRETLVRAAPRGGDPRSASEQPTESVSWALINQQHDSGG